MNIFILNSSEFLKLFICVHMRAHARTYTHTRTHIIIYYYCDAECMFYNINCTRKFCGLRPPYCELAYSLPFFSALEFFIAPLKALRLTHLFSLRGPFILLISTGQPNCQRKSSYCRQLIYTLMPKHSIHTAYNVSSHTRHNNFNDLHFSSKIIDYLNVLINSPFSTCDHNTISFKFLSSANSVIGMLQNLIVHVSPINQIFLKWTMLFYHL